MNAKEIGWRIQQKCLCFVEKRKYSSLARFVTDQIFRKSLRNLHLDPHKLHLNLDNQIYSLISEIQLLGQYDYCHYKKSWNAGFQTANHWPMKFAYDLNYKLRDDIGDARTNWELNRHFQFSILAKNYYSSQDQKYLDELSTLFYDWNLNSPFLMGISWTSVMEVAIRINSWIYCYSFLAAVPEPPMKLLNHLENGIINMAAYVEKHHSRYSSANNHLAVEAYALGMAGILLNNKKWLSKAVHIFSTELPRQNYADGVNKEASLHYQCFFMEAVGLFMRLLQLNNLSVPSEWEVILSAMSRYVSNCIGTYGEKIIFGDDDEGKILNLSGEPYDYYLYILDLMGCILNEKYTDLCDPSENIRWLYNKTQIMAYKAKPLYHADRSICYKYGGCSIMRNHTKDFLIGIDHGALGFGTIAAHGHSDALSFQLYVEGIGVFIDPGTFIYHIWEDERNFFRKTINHNTLCIEGKDQSEMLGPFLWGKKAVCQIIHSDFQKNEDILTASCDGYWPYLHTRKFTFNKTNTLEILDTISGPDSIPLLTLSFLIGPQFNIVKHDNTVTLTYLDLSIHLDFQSTSKLDIEIITSFYSDHYGIKKQTNALRVHGNARTIRTDIKIL